MVIDASLVKGAGPAFLKGAGPAFLRYWGGNTPNQNLTYLREEKSSMITEIGLQLMLISKIQLINQNGKT